MALRTWLVIPDLHVPFQDARFIQLVSKIITLLKPDGVVQLGDAIDWWQLSKYAKDPTRTRDAFDDLAEYAGLLDEWEALLPEGCEWRQLQGNHEHRLERYVAEKAPDLAKMIRSMTEMLRFPERNKRGGLWRWFEMGNWRACKLGDVVLHHGFYFSEHTAHRILQKYKCKMVTGHTHRVQLVSDGDLWAATLGHGSKEDETSHAPVRTGWQQALGVLSIDPQGRGHLEVILVDRGQCIFRGQHVQA